MALFHRPQEWENLLVCYKFYTLRVKPTIFGRVMKAGKNILLLTA
ncbi:hypothetical protein CHY_2011 [Carboxydothermus hydrogenoformans Z-2901]|uniref:Uncharacterized protein n=1 Tax=Carboxydothermus hydrogenoformans (strain ATCC BAA-161 / DSM 6008 / Z-2901) TaxID=246194 RepID=Q3AAK4_CARHZ|nr:hypothetical protein CHY_2011 [Carboxydothermus hydrogenoformans Z-2901]